jgi:SAM-dependent methyltransferase
MELAYSAAEENPLVRAVSRDAGFPDGVDLAIHADDEMLSFLAATRGGDRDRALADYFLSGFQVSLALRQLLDGWFGGAARVGSVLDFASGYGRVTRFLVRELPPDRLTVADIYAGGVAFQRQRFGVRGLASAGDPAAFLPAERFDAVLVTSLFSHLPAPAFHGWMEALWRLVAPGGLLVFSVHDGSLLEGKGDLPAEGILFAEVSESASLGKGDYGTAWVSEEFVRRAVARVAPRASVRRLPRALQHFQDLYLVANGAGDPQMLEMLATLRVEREPLSFLESARLLDPGLLAASGWAASTPEDEEIAAVEALLDGEAVAATSALGPRPDVDRSRQGEPLRARAFYLEIPLPPALSHRAVLSLRSLDRRGHRSLLAASTLETALLEGARSDAARAAAETARVREELAVVKAKNAGLAARIAGMESSRFWAMRNGWFALKRFLRLTDER